MTETAIRVGDAIPPFRREGGFISWSHFAAVNYEFALHHMDDEVAQHEGFTGAFAMAPLTFSYVQAMLREWVADRGRIVTVAIQLRSPFLRGRMLTATGTVTAIREEGGETLVEADIWADDDQGTRLVAGTATVAFAGPGA